MAQNFLAMGSESEQAKAGLTALGWSTEQIENRQAQWLETCKRLVQTIPGLSDIINTQTGEIKGGIPAIQEYVQEYETANKKIIAMQALQQKEQALANKRVEVQSYWLEAERAKKAKEIWEQTKSWDVTGVAPSKEDQEEYEALIDTVNRTTAEYERQSEALKQAEDDMTLYRQAVEEMPGTIDEMTQSTDNATASVRQFSEEEAKAAQTAVKNAESALKSLTDYMDKAYKSTYSSVSSALGGFAKMVTPAEQARQKVKDVQDEIAKLQKAGKSTTELELKMTGYDEAIPTIQNITAGLKSQAQYLQDYINNIARMRELGFSADVLAMVSDGGAQSADYAAELATANKAQVDEINNQVADVKAKTAELSTSLTENKLAVDEGLNQLTADWAAAMAELDKYSDAKGNVAHTLEGITEALQDKSVLIQDQVTNILTMLASLSGGSYGVSVPGVNIDAPGMSGGNSTIQVNTQLNLDGRAVANAVSTHQANSLRNMERSGVTYN
jgi:chromosome segregation ATPase